MTQSRCTERPGVFRCTDIGGRPPISKRSDSLSIPTKHRRSVGYSSQSICSSAKVRPVHIHSRTLAHKGDLFLAEGSPCGAGSRRAQCPLGSEISLLTEPGAPP